MSLAEGSPNDLYAAADNQLWVAVRGTLDLIDLNTMQVTHYPLEPSAGSINAVYQDQAGMVWLGTSGFQLYHLDPSTGEAVLYPLKSAISRPTPPKAIVAFYEDNEENLWIAVNHDGLYRLDPARENVEFFETPPPAPASPITENANDSLRSTIRAPITELYGDRAGYIWLTTLNGFHRFDPRSGTYQSYRINPAQTGPDSYMESPLEDQDGIIWVASRDGLIRFDPTTGTSQYFTIKDGLPTNYLVGILQDTEGNLWLSSKRGLTKFTPSTATFRNYEVSDGLQGTEFAAHVFAQTTDGRMFFGGLNGLTAFYPDMIIDNPYQPTIVLTDFQLFNKSVSPAADSPLMQPIWETDSLILNYDQNILSFEFAALSYADPQETRYRHKLEGFESDWNETDSSRRFITYTNLPSGNYVLRVQSTNNDGIWSNAEVDLKLTILPPWWEETWFRGIALVAFVGVLLGGYQWRVFAIKRRNRALEAEVSERTRALQERTHQLQASEEQLRHAKDAAEAANRAKSAFLANMSHELRSPLNVILGFAQVVNRNPYISPDVHENLDIILQSGEHLLALINQVLDLSKIEAGHLTLNEVDFDFHRLLEELEDMFSLKADEKQLQLLFDRSDDLPRYLRADAVKLRQVLINLIGNALKFTDEGYITVRLKHRQVNGNFPNSTFNLQFEVEDSGVGIAPEEMPSLFEAFAQTSTGRQVQEGTGLGLSITRKFIQMMGGDITVKSELGHGSTFGFQIPCRVVDTVETQVSVIQRRVVGLDEGQAHYRILIVDDKWANRQLLIKLLRPLGFEVREAENGKEALEIAQAFTPHLIFMDMRMPIMDGYEATRNIKAAPELQTTVVIALTASAFDEERAAVLAAGCSDFLRKPFRAEDVFEMIVKHIGVRFLYAKDDEAASAAKGKTQPEDLKSALNMMPAELLIKLTEATELGDIEMMAQVIADIRQHNPTLAEDVAWLAHRFEYDKLLYLLQEAVQ
jgi:signal transduction histidine kinase/streptogramin lyase/DNA-binding NarL/FixJ family response regulator